MIAPCLWTVLYKHEVSLLLSLFMTNSYKVWTPHYSTRGARIPPGLTTRLYHLSAFVFLISTGVKDVWKHSRRAAALLVPCSISEVNCHIKKTGEVAHRYAEKCRTSPGVYYYSYGSGHQHLRHGLQFSNYLENIVTLFNDGSPKTKST